MHSHWILLFVALTVPSSEQFQVGKVSDIKPRIDVNPEQEATAGQFPYQVLLKMDGTLEYCGGAILNHNWVVTAAHCVASVMSPTEIHVIVGEHNTAVHEGPEQGILAKRIAVRPGANSNLEDIALVELSQSMNIDWKFIAPIDVGRPDNGLESTDFKGTLTGWGVDNNGRVSDVLQYSELLRYSDVDCNVTITANGQTRKNNTFCAGDSKTSICKADGGNPYVVRKPNENPHLVGIVSKLNTCNAGVPGIFTDVIPYSEWIIMTINGAVSIAPATCFTLIISLVGFLYAS